MDAEPRNYNLLLVSWCRNYYYYYLFNCVKFSRNKRKRQPIGMFSRSSGNHDWLLANADSVQPACWHCAPCKFTLLLHNARNESDCVWMETVFTTKITSMIRNCSTVTSGSNVDLSLYINHLPWPTSLQWSRHGGGLWGLASNRPCTDFFG